MKVIITENQNRLLRRVSEIEHLIGPMMDLVYEYMKNGNPSPLNMFHYDTFIDFTTLQITKEIVNRTNFQGDDKIELETQIQRFIETEYIDVIREYFYSRMIKDRNINESYDKRILKENNFHLRRRENIMKEKLDSIVQNRFTNQEFQFMPFEHFRLHISDYVGTEMANELNLTGEKRVTFRNQIIQYVRNNFYEHLKEIWESKQNINESYNKKMLQRRYQYISEFIDIALSRYDVCIYTDVIDFVDRVLDYTADNLYESLFKLEWDDNHNEYYQDIYDLISEHFVDRIHEFYEDNKHFCIDEDGNWIH
jgi:truncated hemoglobin YjbI